MGDGGLGKARRMGRALGASPGPVERRLRTQPAASRPSRRGGDHRGLGAGRRGARGLLRPLPAPGRAGLDRPVPGDRVGRVPRPRGGGDHATDVTAGAGVHVADRHLHRAGDAGALVGAPPALDPFPRRRAGAADPAGVRPGACGGGGDRRRLGSLSRGDDGDASHQLPVRVGARVGGHDRGGAGRGDRRGPARRRAVSGWRPGWR